MTTILVIDDDLQMRRQMVEILTTAGYDTFEAKDGREGVRMFSLLQPELVITEIVMPGMDGLEIIGDLRRERRRVPIIAVSEGRVGRGRHYLELARMFGADAVITKPFQGGELVDTVHRLL
jgi:DNA-binding response OmpR family regulator